GFPLRNQPTRSPGGTITNTQNGLENAAQTEVDMDQWNRNQPTRSLGGTITNTQNGIGNAAQTEVDMDQWNRACVDKWISTKEQVLDVAANHCSIVHGCVHGGYLSAVDGDDGS
nr:hypothetical protein [Tanacetum cinerariifolium]